MQDTTRIFIAVQRWLFPLIVALSFGAKAQFPVTLRVTGEITLSDSSTDFTGVKIFNKRMDDFVKPGHDGTFELFGFKSDTFVFICPGYSFKELSFKDSLKRPVYDVHVTLHRPLIALKEVVIVPEKTIEQIQNEIDNLYIPNTDIYKDPPIYPYVIDKLWELFSRTEKEKRKVAQLMDADMRRAVMKELLNICIRDHFIDLQSTQMNSFIDYCNYSDAYLQQADLYTLLSNIKINYNNFAGK